MITNLDDLYRSVREVRDELSEAGEEEKSRALDDAMYIGSTSGEILGEIRLQLRALRRDPVIKRLRLEGRIDEMLTAIDSTLGP